MNKFVKLSLIVLGCVLLVGILIYFKLFIIGNKNFESIVIDKVTVNSNSVVITGGFSDSARAFKDYSYTQVGNELYVVIKSVMVSKKYDNSEFTLSIPVNGMNVTDIHLSDDKNTKVIYRKTDL